MSKKLSTLDHLPKQFWYPIIQSKKISKKPILIKRFGQNIILQRGNNGQLYAFSDRCPHRGASLRFANITNNCIECPYHGFQYDFSGNCTYIPANGKNKPVSKSLKLKMFHVEEQHGLVWLWWGEKPTSYPKIPWFDEATSTNWPMSVGTLEVPISFFRWMESSLDCHHFWYVHKFMRPKKAGPVADPYHYSLEGNRISTWGRFRPELSTNNSLSSPDNGEEFQNIVIFPNLMLTGAPCMHYLGIIANAPIDENHTWVSFHYWVDSRAKFLLGTLKAWLFLQLSIRIIIPQDIRIQSSQHPKDQGMDTDILAAKADMGTALYWKLRKFYEPSYESNYISNVEHEMR